MNYIRCERDEHVATIIIDRPKALNALNAIVLEELGSVISCLKQENDVKVVIITGAGEKAFVAGADIEAMQCMCPKEAYQFSSLGHRILSSVESSSFFTIAAVNGYALGGGCELALACDIRVASNNAKIGIPEASLGLIPGFGGTQRLPRLVGLSRAKEILATGRPIMAREALSIGLVNHTVEPAQLLPFCKELANKIVTNSSSAIRLGKLAMNAGVEMDQAKAMQYEIALFAMAFDTRDAKEGMLAFMERRKAQFQ